VAVDRLPTARDLLAIATALFGVAVSLLVGFAVGNQTPTLLIGLGALVALAVIVVATFRPRLSFWILLTSTVTLPVIPVTANRGANPVDILLLPALLGAWLLVPAPADDLPREAKAAGIRVVRAAWLLVGAALVSLVALAVRGFGAYAADSLLPLLRLIQGFMFYGLGMRLLRNRADLRSARNAIVWGFLIGAVVNVIGLAVLGSPRAGMTWNLLDPNYFISSPNEAGFAVTFLWVLVLAMPFRNKLLTAAVLAISIVFLLATNSRSGLVSWLTFVTVWGVIHRKGRLLLLPLGLALLFPFLPDAVTAKFTRTLMAQRGSFEIYSTLVRVYAWKTAIIGFQHNPIFGVGYLCFRYFSHMYNTLTLNLGTAENIVLEFAVDTGVIGLTALFWLGASIVRLVRAVARSTAPGSPEHELARLGMAFLVAELIANMTGNNLIGMVSAAQLAVFCAFLVTGARSDAGQVAAP
jgi:hypothetical protein